MDERELDPRAMAVAAEVARPSLFKATKTEVDGLFESDIFDVNRPNDKQSIVDSKTLPLKVKKAMKLIKKDSTSAVAKIKIAEFMCDKLCDIYRISLEKREILANALFKVVMEGENLAVPLRLRYLKFRNETVPYKTSVQLYRGNVREQIRTVPYFQILKYILRSAYKQEPDVQAVLDEFDALFEDEGVSIYTKMEVADIFLLNNRPERGNEMLERLRQMEFNLVLDPNDANNAALYQRMRTVYGDSQNVHGSDLNESVLRACVRLMEIETPNGFDSVIVSEVLCSVAPEHRHDIQIVLERIEIDTSRFRSGDNLFGLYDVFSSLWAYINNHPSAEELYVRLVEEMVAMAKYCTTGHVSRFINAIQGYTDDEQLHVRISDEQQIRAVLAHYLDTVLTNATEDVANAMCDDDKQPFYDFVTQKVNDKIPELFEIYGEVQEHIITAVKAYTRWDFWSIMDNTLSCDPRPPPMLEVSDECLESYPCQHHCVFDGEALGTWDGWQIHAWYVERDLEVPEHFAEYAKGWSLENEVIQNSDADNEAESDEEELKPQSWLSRAWERFWCAIM